MLYGLEPIISFFVLISLRFNRLLDNFISRMDGIYTLTSYERNIYLDQLWTKWNDTVRTAKAVVKTVCSTRAVRKVGEYRSQKKSDAAVE